MAEFNYTSPTAASGQTTGLGLSAQSASPSSPPADSGVNWLSAISDILQAGAAGYQGDYGFVARQQAQKQNTQLKQQEMQMRQREMDLGQIKAINEGVSVADNIMTNFPEGPNRDNVMKQLETSYKKLGIEIPFTELAAGSGEGLKNFKAQFQFAEKAGLPEDILLNAYRISKDPKKGGFTGAQAYMSNVALQLSTKTIQAGHDPDTSITNALNNEDMKKFKEVSGSAAEAALSKEAQNNPEVMKSNLGQLIDSKLFPGAGELNDQQISRLKDRGFTKLKTSTDIKADTEKPVNVGTDREALALEKGFKNFAEAPKDQQAAINKEVKRREDERLALAKQNVNIRVDQAETNKTRQGAIDARQIKMLEGSMRKDFEGQSKTFKDQAESFAKIEASAKNPSPAGDLSMIFAYMKLLDPISVVREGEQATAAAARSVPESVWGLYNRMLTGEKLTPKQRADFVDRSKQLYSAAKGMHDQRVGEFRRVAESTGANPDNVVIEMGAPTAGNSGGGVVKLQRNPKTGKLEEVRQ